MFKTMVTNQFGTKKKANFKMFYFRTYFSKFSSKSKAKWSPVDQATAETRAPIQYKDVLLAV